MALTIDQVWRDFNSPNVPGSGDHEPVKSEIRALLKQIQNSGGQSVTRNTLTALNAVTPPNENYMGIVLSGAGSGYYSRSGSSWVFGRSFPDTLARVTLTGSGSAQIGTVSAGVYPSSIEVFYAKVATPNTGPMTLTIDGITRPVVNLVGNPLAADEWTGMVMFYLNDADQYQLLIDAGAAVSAATSASLAGQNADRAKDEADRSDAAADRAEDFAAMLSADKVNFNTVPLLLADEMLSYTAGPGKIVVAAGDILGAGGFRYEVLESDAAASVFRVDTAGGVRLSIRNGAINGFYNVLAWGVVPGGATSTDNFALLQQAIDTQRNIIIPPGHYYSSATLKPYQGQRIVGGGGAYVAKTRPTTTRITFANDVTGFDNVANIAYGSSLEGIYCEAQDTTQGSGSYGVRHGLRGTEGGTSQAIKCYTVDCTFEGFDINAGTYGWSWEVCYVRTVFIRGRACNTECADAFTLVTYDNCSWLEAGIAYGTDPTRQVSGARFTGSANDGLGRQVAMIHPRFENNLQGGFIADQNVRIAMFSPYFENNRIFDIQLNPDFRGTLKSDGGIWTHDNAVTTTACIRVTSSRKCSVILDAPNYSLGRLNNNQITEGFIAITNPAPYVEVRGLLAGNDLAKMISGNKRVVYLSQSGYYSPQRFSIAGLNAEFFRAGNSHLAQAWFRYANLNLTDGVSTFNFLTLNSIAFEGGNMYRWDGSAWSLKTTP